MSTTETTRPTVASQRLMLAREPADDAERDGWTKSLTMGLRQHAFDAGACGITDQPETSFYSETDYELAARQDRENRDAENENREPTTLSRMHFAWADATIVWPEPSPDGNPVLVPRGWVDLGDRGWVATMTNPADHDVCEWRGRLVWLDGARYRVTGTERFMSTHQGRGSDMGLLVEPEPLETADA